jgi:hypothetical protein
MSNKAIIISEHYDDEGHLVEGSYVVCLSGEAADEFGISEEYFDSDVDAYGFAEEVSDATGEEITWEGIKPSWA